jgi:uncharacterized protein involved in exopolysaccharide biosynthesis
MSEQTSETRSAMPIQAHPVAAQRRSGISAIAILNTLLRYRLLLVGIPLVVGLYVVATRLIRGSTYIATSRFVPEAGSSDASRLLGLASQFGVAIPRTGSGESLDFYAELVKSQDLLRDVVTTRFREAATAPHDTVGPTLIEIYGVAGKDLDEQVRQAVALLRLNLTVMVDDKANVVTVTTSANSPTLAVAINRRILDLINSFNLRKRQSKAAAERGFVEGRLAAAQKELNSAESALENFLEANRQFRGSPELTVQQARLQRAVDLRQQLYTSLAQAYEQARIEEVRNTPVVTVVDRPEGSARRNNRLLIRLLLALAPAVILALSLALAHDYLQRQEREDPEEYERFRQLRRGLLPRLGRRQPDSDRRSS